MIRITVDDERLLAALARKPEQAVAAVSTKLRALDTALAAKIVGEKLSGQVLQKRTGILAQSIRDLPIEREGMVLSGVVQGGGAEAWYARIHEFGGTFSRKAGSVRLRTDAKGNLLKQLSGRGAIFARTTHTRVREVKYGSGTVTFPERPFMRPALEESREQITSGIREALIEALLTK